MSKKVREQYKYEITDGENGKILLGMPRERVSFNKFIDNRDAMLATLQAAGRGTQYYSHESSRIDRNRDRIGEYFLSHPDKPPWLLMIDTDMEHPLDLGIRLSRHNLPIIGALYFHRGDQHDPFVFKYDGKHPDMYGRKQHRWRPMREEVYDFLTEHQVPHRDGALVINDPLTNPIWKVDAVATGALLIHRSVLLHMERPWFEFKAGGVGEDLMFCWEATNLYGIPVHADVSTVCGHYNWQAMGHAQFRQIHVSRGITMTNYTDRQAALWIAELFEIEQEEALKKYKAADPKAVGEYWLSKFGEKEPSKEEVNNFYNEKYVGKLYLLELLAWNMSPLFQRFKKSMIEIRKKKVIEIGAGIGSMTLQMATQTNDVVAIEPNPILRKFMHKRMKQHYENSATELGEIVVHDTAWIGKYDPESFDAALAFDVLEHLEKDTLCEIMAELSRVLKPGGQLHYHANFKQQDIYPMHFDYSEEWDDILAKYGFVQQTPTMAVKVVQDD